MFGAMEITADCRRQDMLAMAARERLSSQAQPIEPTMSVLKTVSSSTRRIVCACGRRALAARLVFSAHSFGPRSDRQEQAMFTAAR